MTTSEIECFARNIKGVSQRILIEALIEEHRPRLPNLSRDIRAGATRIQDALLADFNAMDRAGRAKCVAETVVSIEASISHG